MEVHHGKEKAIRLTLRSDGLQGSETPSTAPLPFLLLEPIARQFAEAILTDDSELAKELLTPEAMKRLGRSGLQRFLPRGWKTTVRQMGTSEAIAQILEHLTIESALDEDLPGEPLRDLAPDVPAAAVRGVVSIIPGDPDWDIDAMCVLHFVEMQSEPRIAFVS